MKARKLHSETKRWNWLKRLDNMASYRHHAETYHGLTGKKINGPSGYKRIQQALRNDNVNANYMKKVVK